jgi:glycosidase
MKHNTVQLLVRGEGPQFHASEVETFYSGIHIDKVHALDGKYLAIDLTIMPQAQPGTIAFAFRQGKKTQNVNWVLKPRSHGKVAQGITSADLIYLIMPDRFSNGDPTNDKIKGLRDQSLDRDSIFLRHGGDLQGIINHLDYLQDLGITTLWLTPVWLNDMPNRTEHGYAITNHYQVDPRLGNNERYKRLSDELHKRNMKLIQDAVYNHVGFYHFFVQDKPTPDWLHEFPAYTNTTYKDQPLMDPHAAADDRKHMSDGWFTPMMPDLNQNNPYVANFLIQHALWSVEEFGVDGWRIDTYIYNDLAFMNRCNQALLEEYPNISLFGETWVHGTANQAFFTRNTINVPFKSNLPGVTDFQTNLYGIAHALNEPFGWTNGVNRLYQTLAKDFLYEDPTKNVIFLDNHDMSRFFSAVNEDIGKLKVGIAWLLTCRGIPQLYYGTEILMKGVSNPDGWVRLDFPGGWKGDPVDKFSSSRRTPQENDVFDWTRKLSTFRRSSSALKTGKMTQYVPENGVYVYFRHDDQQTVMCVMNTNDKPTTLKPERFNERLRVYKQGREIVSEKMHDLQKLMEIPAKYIIVLELIP